MKQRPFTQPRSLTPIMVVAVLLAATVFAQPSPTIRGSWAASAGPNQVFQGTWTAQTVGNDPNTAQGTWTLVNQSNQIAAQGTWSAVKNARTWSGTWQARVTANNRILSGSWRTQIATSEVRSLADMFQRALQDQVSGTWGSGRLAGSWSIRAYQ